MTDNQLLRKLVGPHQAAQALYAYGVYFQTISIYRRTKAAMKHQPIGYVLSSNTKTVRVNSDIYASSKIYTHQ